MQNNKEIVISFDPAGGVRALHMDEFPLSFLGKMEISRASTIDFDPQTQRFDINLKEATSIGHYRDGFGTWRIQGGDLYPRAACGFKGYDEARAYEVAWIQECMKRGVDPLGPEGVDVICGFRAQGSDSPQL